jgi:hypothetical protein
MTDSDPRYISHAAAYEAVRFGPPDFEIKTADDVNQYLDYLMSLMKGAETLFLAGHFHLSAFRKAGADRKKGRDPLRNHHHKQKAAVAVVFMGGRLHKVLGGEEAANDFHRKINNGYLNEVREKSLYCFAGVGGFVRPTDFVDTEMARVILLVAIETVDDTFCGMTDHSYQVSKGFDEMFESIRGSEVSYGI